MEILAKRREISEINIEYKTKWLSHYPLLRLQHVLQVSDYLALKVLGFLFLEEKKKSERGCRHVS